MEKQRKRKNYVLIVSRKFLKEHPKSGFETNFVEKILNGKKVHTIRPNVEYWKKVLFEVQLGNAILSIRYWTGKPYISKQKIVANLTDEHCIGYEIINLKNIIKYDNEFLHLIASNDGLEVKDFLDWFKYEKLKEHQIIIHFSPMRYGSRLYKAN